MVCLYLSEQCKQNKHESCHGGFPAFPGSFGGSRCTCTCHVHKSYSNEEIKKIREDIEQKPFDNKKLR